MEKALRPLFERFCHNGVVGVGNDVRGDVPSLIPTVAVFVEKKAHKFGYAKRGMRVVDVDCHSVREVVETWIELQVTAQYRLNGRRNEEVLLFKAQRFAFDVVVGGIKHFVDGLCHSLCRARLDIFALAEHIHIEILRRLRLPKSQTVDRARVVTGYVHIVRHGVDDGAISVSYGEFAVLPVLVHNAAELDLIGFFGTRIEPNVAHFEPIVGLFELPTVNDDLLENAVVVKNAESVCRIIARRERIHICCGKSAEAAVSETRVGLESVDFVHLYAETFNCFGHLVGDTHIEKMVAKRPAEQKFHRHIVDLFCVLRTALFFEVYAFAGEQIANDHTSCAVDLRFACVFGFYAEITR